MDVPEPPPERKTKVSGQGNRDRSNAAIKRKPRQNQGGKLNEFLDLPDQVTVLTSSSISSNATESPLKAPRTYIEARSLAHSDYAKALVDLAASIAVETRLDRPQIDAHDFLWALLVDGERRPRADSASRWLHDWIEARAGDRLRVALLPYQNIKRIPVDGVLPLSAHASALIVRAVSIARITVNRDVFDLRHIAAALALQDTTGANENVLRLVKQRFDINLTDFPRSAIQIIASSSERHEKLAAWESLLVFPIPSPSLKEAAASSPRALALSGFATDRPSAADSDPLSIQADVSAFARLICLEEARPPLSIGLFGEWGSGKSSFMERLQSEIAKLTKKKRDGRRTRDETIPGPRFVENVVQIRFNAWHFADANLWASLTAEFFDQLRRGGHEGQRSSKYLALVGKVADHVRSLEAIAYKADGAVIAAIAAEKKANEALAEAREKLAESDLSLASVHLGKALEDFQKNNAASLRDVGMRIYRNDLSTDINELKAAISEASTMPGKIALVSRSLASGGLATWLGLSSVVLFAVIGVMWRYGDSTSLAVLIQRAIGWGGGTLAALGAVWQALGKVRPVLDGAWEYAKAVEATRKELAAEVRSREAAAASATNALDDAISEAETAKVPLAEYGQGAQTSAPGTILRYFLFEEATFATTTSMSGSSAGRAAPSSSLTPLSRPGARAKQRARRTREVRR